MKCYECFWSERKNNKFVCKVNDFKKIKLEDDACLKFSIDVPNYSKTIIKQESR